MPVGRCVMRTAESVTLTCWPPAPLDRIGVDAQVLLRNVDLDVLVEFRPDVDRGERGVPARRLIERRDAHEPMHAGLGRHQAERVLAGQRQGHALEAGLFAGLIVEHLALEAAPLRPLQVHPQQHLGPVLRLGAAGARVDRDDRVGGVVLAAQHLLDFAGVDLALRARRAPSRRSPPTSSPPCAHSSSTPRSSIFLPRRVAQLDVFG